MQKLEQERDQHPALIVAFGVSGSGKSTVSRALAEQLGLTYLDADDFHSADARRRMARGEALTDELRAPWIHAICAHLKSLSGHRENTVLAFSGLKKKYREPLRHTGFQTTFLFLDGDKATILERMTKREGHFMPTALLDSQFATLEDPVGENDVERVDITAPLDSVLEQALACVRKRHSQFQVS